MELDLHDKIGLVTGGGRGVGEAICRRLAGEGVRVAVADIDKDGADRVAESIGGLALQIDVADHHQVVAGLQQVESAWGGLQIVVSNVGLTLPGFLDDIADTDVDRTFAVNMRGPLNVTRAAVPLLRKASWGRLIFIGSSSGLKASAGLALYSASKYFLHGLSAAAGVELGRDKITANIVCPSDIYPTREDSAGSWLNPDLVEISCQKAGVSDLGELQAKRVAATPAGRSCTSDDVAHVVTFLASPLADFINAQSIGINGGALPT